MNFAKKMKPVMRGKKENLPSLQIMIEIWICLNIRDFKRYKLYIYIYN